MRFTIVILFVLFIAGTTMGQKKADSISLFEYEDSLKHLFNEAFEFDGVKFLKTDDEKRNINQHIVKVFNDALLADSSFSFPFDSLNYVGRINSDDEKIRIFSWNLQYRDRSFEYFAFLQCLDKNNISYKTIQLIDKSSNIPNPEKQILNDQNWFGALYYKIITCKQKNKTYYTLLGWDGNSDLSSKKVIDVIRFSKKGDLILGANVFFNGNTTKNRVIFEYSAKVSMLLRYDKRIGKIVFDHLVPFSAGYKGNFQFYGPDMTHDAYEYSEGKWIFISDIVLTNQKKDNSSGSLYNPESNDFYKQPEKKER